MKSGFISVAGKRLETAHWPGHAPTLVLLHEGLGSVGLWRQFPQALAAATGCAVLAYSRAGYGASDPCDLPRPLDYMTREAREVLPDVLRDIGPHILIGHSDGASIAAIHAGRVANEATCGLCLIAPHFFTEPAGLAAIARARDAYETGDLRDRLARHHGNVDAAFHGWNGAWLDPGFAAWNIEDVLDGIDVPVQVIQGDADPYGTLAQVAAVTDRIPSADAVVLPGVGHAPHVERPDETIAAIARLLARCESGVRA